MYIRTKDGVYELVDTYYMCVDGVETYMYNDRGRGVEIRGGQILKQSENLEELCDEFVLHYGDTMQTSIPIPWATYERRDDNWQKHKEKLISELKKAERKATVYGAIWTSKGLIYVAKIDNEGKLVLI